MPLAETVCTHRRDCGLCRDSEGGRTWRTQLARAFVLPPGAPDFECPFGVEWGAADGWTPDMPARGLGDVVAKVTHAVGITPCGGCRKRQAAMNAAVPFER